MSGFGLSLGKGRSGSGGGAQELKMPSVATGGSGSSGSSPPTLRRSASDMDSLSVIEERLGSLCDCISRDVMPGLERELSQVCRSGLMGRVE